MSEIVTLPKYIKISQMDKISASRNLGFITGPLMLGLGIFAYQKGEFPVLAIVMIILGTIRIGLTLYSYFLSKKQQQE